MRLVTFASIIQQARVWLNVVGSAQPPDSDIMQFVAQDFADYYERVIDASDSNYYWNTYQFLTVAGQNGYAVPIDQNRVKRVDSLIQNASTPGNQQWGTVKRYDTALKYAMAGFFNQAIPGGQTIQISYVPNSPQNIAQYAFLSITTADTFDSITFTATNAGLPGQAVQIAITLGGAAGAAVVTVSGMVITVEIGAGCTAQTVVTAFQGVAAAVFLASCACTQPNDLMVQTAQPATPLGGTLQFDFPANGDRFIVAGVAGLIAMRLGRDASPWVAERNRLEPLLAIRATKRDENWPPVAKDTMRDQMMGRTGLLWAVTQNRFSYNWEGQNIDIRPWLG